MVLLDLDNLDSVYTEEEKKLNNMEIILNMVDAEHSIVVTPDLGLVGYGYEDENDTNTVITNGINEHKLAVLNNCKTIYGCRGNYFLPVDKDGCIIFDEYVTMVGILCGDKGVEGYIFVLKDYEAQDDVADIFNDEFKPALILYKNNKLYTNNFTNMVKAKEIGEQITDFTLLNLSKDTYSLIINGETYNSHKACNGYKIYYFYKRRMKL